MSASGIRLLGLLRVAMAVPALLDTENVAAVNRIVSTTPFGDLMTPLPTPLPRVSGYDQRQMQRGFKFAF